MTTSRPLTDEPTSGSPPRWLEPETVSPWKVIGGCALLVLLVLAGGYVAMRIWVAMDTGHEPADLPATSAGPAPASAGKGGIDARPDVDRRPPYPANGSAATPNGDGACAPGAAALGLCSTERR